MYIYILTILTDLYLSLLIQYGKYSYIEHKVDKIKDIHYLWISCASFHFYSEILWLKFLNSGFSK